MTMHESYTKGKRKVYLLLWYYIIILLLYNKDFVKSLVTVTRPIEITVEFQFHYFVFAIDYYWYISSRFYYGFNPSERFYNNNWLKIHQNHCFQVKQENFNSIIIGDSIVAGLTRYTNVWNNLFGNRFINLGISGDRVENVLWRARDIPFLPSLKNVVILCGTNNINKDSPYDIAQGLTAIGSVFKNQSNNPNIFICGLLPAMNLFFFD